jgi:hypothetical protein
MILFDDSILAWTGIPVTSGDRTVTFSFSDEDDTVSAGVSVTVIASLSTTDEDDVVAFATSHVVATTWTQVSDDIIEWPQAWIEPAASERTVSFSFADEDDTVNVSVSIVVSASLSTTDEDDIVAFTATAPALVKGTWTQDAEGLLEWNPPVIVEAVAERNLSLATTDEDDVVAFVASHEAEVEVEQEPAGEPKRKRKRIIEKIEPVIPETQEIPEEPKRKRPKIDITKYEMVDIPKVISEGWKPKAKYHEPISSKDTKFLEKTLPHKPNIDELARELEAFAKEESRKRMIREQNDLIIMLAMEEA